MTPPTRLDDLLPYLMNRLLAQLNQNLSEQLRRQGYSFQEWRILAVVAAHDGVTVSDIAEAAVIPQPTVSRLVAQMEERSYLTRRNARADSRFVTISITRAGRAAYADMLPLAVQEYEAAIAGFAPQETERLLDAVRRMMRNAGVALIADRPPPPTETAKTQA
jgi:DNA-binding MarR family transcriptional regulator